MAKARGGTIPEAVPVPPEEPRCTGMVEVRVQDPREAPGVLAAGVEAVRDAADRYGTGILVTEIGEGIYVVRAHPAVPHGLVRHQGSGSRA